MENFLDIHKQLLSLYYSGIYITNSELREIGEKLGFEQPLKDREFMIKQLRIDAREAGKNAELLQELKKLIAHRISGYEAYKKAYPKAGGLVDSWIEKARAHTKELEEELA